MKSSYVTVTDQFCGAGGSSLGAAASGAEIKLALNHWPLAIETHNTNFPNAAHDCADISASDPRRYPSTDILIGAPECTNHSLSKGVKRQTRQLSLLENGQIDPAAERSRATMWDVPRFAEFHRYNIIIVENVPDARHWVMWDAWLMAMHLLGYGHRCVFFNSMFAHPTPQSRDRMYVVFWRKGNRAPDLDFYPPAWCSHCERNVDSVQSWKSPTKRWGKYRQQYVYRCPQCAAEVQPFYYCAANAIDWSLPAPRIGDRRQPLKEKTLARIRYGLEKFGRQPAPPLVIPMGYTHERHDRRSYPLTDALPTQTARQDAGLCVPPFITILRENSRTNALSDPLATLCAGGSHHGLVVPPAWIVANYSPGYVKAVDQPLGSITCVDHHSLLTAPFLTSYYGTDQGHSLDEPMGTVTTRDRHALVAPPFLMNYYTRNDAVTPLNQPVGTVVTEPRHSLVCPESIEVEDCGFRMLQPHEVGRAMAFPDSYKVLGNKREKIRQYGNAVTPPAMQWLMERCIATLN